MTWRLRSADTGPMRIQVRTPSRAGLAGNPSDAYGGRAVAVALADLEARVTLRDSDRISISSSDAPPLELESPASLDEPRLVDTACPHRLAVASCRRFFAWAEGEGQLPVPRRPGNGFRLSYTSSIPRYVGLAGSSALVIGFLRALSLRYDVHIPESDLPGVALAAETEELGIHGGLMDRVAQAMGGITYMDLADERVRKTGRGLYEPLPSDVLPPLFVAWDPSLAAGSETVHNRLKERVRGGDPEAKALLRELADLADEARSVLLSARPRELSRIMDRNFDLRARLVEVGDGNRRLVRVGREMGAGVKQTGSGGAVVGASDGDPERVSRLRDSYARIGARFFVPDVWSAPRGESTYFDEIPRDSETREPETGSADDA